MPAASDITKTYDCKTKDCPNESRSPVGRYAYCDACRERRASMSDAEKPTPAPATAKTAGKMEDAVKRLATAAREADKLAAHAKKLTERALAAKQNADAAAEKVRQIAREITGG